YTLPDYQCRFRVRAEHHSLEAFLDSTGSPNSALQPMLQRSPSQLEAAALPDLPRRAGYHLTPPDPPDGTTTPLRHPITTLHTESTPTSHTHAPDRSLTHTRFQPVSITAIAHTRHSGTGISTGSPSTTPLGLALGPD